MDVPSLEEAVQLMQDVPKEANDHMALSMIDGYEGNIHANGQIILQVSVSSVDGTLDDYTSDIQYQGYPVPRQYSLCMLIWKVSTIWY